MAANTDHDEQYIRAHWHGAACSDSTLAPRRGRDARTLRMTYIPELGIELPSGVIHGDHVSTTGRKTYR